MANVTGQITINQVSVLEVDAPPGDGGGTAAPIGSIACYNNGTTGTFYIKRTSANTGWNIFSPQVGAFTSTRIPFANVDGLLTDSANLNWDNTNSRLGVNLSALSRTLHISTTTGSGDNGIFVDAYGSNAGAISIRKANGTQGSPTAITSGQVFAEFDAFGYGTSAFSANQTGSIAFIAAENFTNTARGTHIGFYTTPIGSSTETERVRITAAGNLGVGTTTPTAPLQVSNSSNTSFMRVTPAWFGAGEGTWIDLDITGPSGVGFGGPGANPWLAYCSSAGNWFTDSAAGDVAYRNTTGRILIGTTSGQADIKISSTGQVAIGNQTQQASAKLQVDSTTQGFLMPRMTSAQRVAIASPATGLAVYDTDLGSVVYFNGSVWVIEINLVTTATQSTTSNNYVNGIVTELTTPSLPVGRYTFLFNGIFQSTATATGVGARLAGGTSSTVVFGSLVANWNISQAGNGTDKDFQYSQLDATANVTSASALTANADFPVIGSGVFQVTTAGTVAIQIRSESNGTGISIRAGSNLRIWKNS